MFGRSRDDADHPHHAAYVEAWDERRRTGVTDVSLLRDALARRGVGGPASEADRVVQGLVEEEWARGSSPRRMRWRLATEAGRMVWSSVSSLVQVLGHDDDRPSPGWAVLPDGVRPMSDVARGWSVEDDRELRVDAAGRAVARRVVDTTTALLGTHVADAWVRVRSDVEADVLVGPEVVGTVPLVDGEADRMRGAERCLVHVDASVHLRAADDPAPLVQLWLPPHGPVDWPAFVAWSEDLDDEDDEP